MSIKLSFSRQDMAMHKLPALLLAVTVLAGVFSVAGAYYFRQRQSQALLVAQSVQASAAANFAQAEDEKRTIEEYIERYQKIKAEGLMEEESRLDLVEAIGRARNRFKLYPVQLEIEQQKPAIPGQDGQENSETGFSLRASPIRLSLPLLHEEDLSRFFEELYKNKGLFVVESCSVTRGSSASRPGYIGVEATLSAVCQMHWLTIRQAGSQTDQQQTGEH